MKKNKITFLVLETILLVLALFFVLKIFDKNVPEKRVAVILSESGDNRWDSLIKGLKQAADINGLHMIICNTDKIDSTETEKEIINEQKNNDIDAFIICPAPGADTEKMIKKQCSGIPYILIMDEFYNGTQLINGQSSDRASQNKAKMCIRDRSYTVWLPKGAQTGKKLNVYMNTGLSKSNGQGPQIKKVIKAK